VIFRLSQSKPAYENSGGSIRIADSTNFPAAKTVAADAGPHANTTDFRAGDVGLVRRNLGHYVENTGDDALIFIETFRSDHYEEVSLATAGAGAEGRRPHRLVLRPAAAGQG
jgi:oxalate decarboxylase